MSRVLIVDDELPLLRNLKSFLSSCDGEFDPLTAPDAETALQVLEAEEPDILITDVRLPGMDGIELVRQVRQRHPGLPILVMTAFGSGQIREAAFREGALRFIEKPLDLKDLRRLLESVGTSSGWSGFVGGLTIFDIAQLLTMSGMSRTLRVRYRNRTGILAFENGNLFHAAAGELSGDEAFYHMTGWTGGSFEDMDPGEAGDLMTNVTLPTPHLVMEAARRQDEALRPTDEPPRRALGENHHILKEEPMNIREQLSTFTDIVGFRGAAVFSPQGEMIDGVTREGLDINSVGLLANNALLNAQKATDQMGIGRGNLMQIRAQQGIVVMRCYNEATDFSATKTGKAHFHLVVVMEPDGNVGMANMALDKVVGDIAEVVR